MCSIVDIPLRYGQPDRMFHPILIKNCVDAPSRRINTSKTNGAGSVPNCSSLDIARPVSRFFANAPCVIFCALRISAKTAPNA